MEEILRKIKGKEEYKNLSRLLGKSGALRSEIIGNVSEECKKCNTKNFDEWFLYYLEKEKSNLREAAKRLQKQAQEQGYDYSYETCYECVLVFVVLITWVGTKMEEKAMNELSNCRYKIHFSSSDEDILYAVDLYVTRNGKRLYGIQVKPISYYYKTINNPNDYVVVKNKEKNELYRKKYGYEVIYLYYTNEEFDKKDIDRIKKIILDEVERLCKVS